MEILIDGNYEGKLVREVLKKELGFSVNLIKKLKFSPDGIKVNGSWVTVRYELRKGDVLFLNVEDKPEEVSPYIIPGDFDVEVIYEDGYVTAVNKPPDMPTHPSHGHRLDTVANALARRYADRPYVFRPVNRLDRDTSGCVLTANTKDASYKMYSAMVSGKIRKTYLAVTDGVPGVSRGELRSYMRRHEESIIVREECGENDEGAKLALTEYEVLSSAGGHTLILLRPLTGRTHQLRVQLAGIGCPIHGDSLYGKASEYIGRHALHSWKTVFPHPYTGESVELCAPLPEDMKRIIDLFELDTETLL